MQIISLLLFVIIYIFGVINLFGTRPDLVSRSLIYFGVGSLLYVIVKKMKLEIFRSNAFILYLFSLLSLITVFIIGLEVKGSVRWLDLYAFRFQPSEFFKIFFIIYLANLFASSKNTNKSILLAKSLIAFVIPFILIFKQPDLGSGMIIFIIYLSMVLFSQIPKSWLVKLFAGILICLPIIWFTLHDYQKNRIHSFVNPKVSVNNTSYNMTQAIIAIGSGGVFGRGLGMGKQSQLYFLPEFYTDFAYSSLVEQFGLLGGGAVVILYLTLFGTLFLKMYRYSSYNTQSERFKFYCLLGFTTFLVAQTCINLGMNLGILPIAGITLPFISYGGSSMITFMIGIGLFL